MPLCHHILLSEFLIPTVSQGIPLLTSWFRTLSYDNRRGSNAYFFNIEHKISFEYKNRLLNVFVCMTVWLNIYLRAFLVHSEALPQAFLNPGSFSVKIKKKIINIIILRDEPLLMYSSFALASTGGTVNEINCKGFPNSQAQ